MNRALVLAGIVLSFGLVVSLGVWTRHLPTIAVPVVVVIAVSSTFLCNALRIGPPGACMFVLASAAATAMPVPDLAVWQVGLLVLSGGAVVIRTLGTLPTALDCVATGPVTTEAAKRARRDLQQSVFILVSACETAMGGLQGQRAAAEQKNQTSRIVHPHRADPERSQRMSADAERSSGGL